MKIITIVLIFILKPCSLVIPLAIEGAGETVEAVSKTELLKVPKSLSKKYRNTSLANFTAQINFIPFPYYLNWKAHFFSC